MADSKPNGKQSQPVQTEYYHDILASALAHDIVGPLGFAVQIIRAMASGQPDEATLSALAQCLEESHGKAEEILRLMRSKVTVDAGAEQAPLNLTDLTTHKIASLCPSFPADFVWKGKGEVTAVSNAAAVSTAIENILTNAAKYSTDRQVQLHCFEKNGMAMLEAENTTGEDAARIAEVLAADQVPSSQERACIGIYVSRSMVRMCGGDITFEAPQSDRLRATLSLPGKKQPGRKG